MLGYLHTSNLLLVGKYQEVMNGDRHDKYVEQFCVINGQLFTWVAKASRQIDVQDTWRSALRNVKLNA